jgi:hypothetical protein
MKTALQSNRLVDKSYLEYDKSKVAILRVEKYDGDKEISLFNNYEDEKEAAVENLENILSEMGSNEDSSFSYDSHLLFNEDSFDMKQTAFRKVVDQISEKRKRLIRNSQRLIRAVRRQIMYNDYKETYY